MNDNLAEMLTNFTKDADSTNKDEEKKEMTNVNETQVVPETTEGHEEKTETTDKLNIEIIPFIKWIEKNNVNLGPTSDVTKVKVSVSEVDPASSIGFKAPNVKGEKDEEGKVKKDLFFIKDISDINVLDLPVYHIKFYKGNIFRIIHQCTPDIFIKEYVMSSKTGSTLIFCAPIDFHLIPYSRLKVKKNAKEITLEKADFAKLNEKMNGIGDIEALQLMYKQSINVKDKLTSMKEIVSWISKRYENAIDVNHQLQIDGVLITQFK